ncbi:MAG: hypothetical protein AAGC44_00800 [Planctomycetota bacterium]
MRHGFALWVVAYLLLSVGCGDNNTQQSDLPKGQAPATQPEPRVEPDPALVGQVNPDQEPQLQAGDDDQPGPSDVSDPPAEQGDGETEPAGEPAAAERSQGPGLTYVLPQGWSTGQPSRFRLMTLVGPESGGSLELSVSRGNGSYGGFHGNVMRWAGQVGLSDADAARIDTLETVQVDGIEAIWLPLVNEAGDKALIAVWVPRGPDPTAPLETWVLKFPAMPGPVEQVMAGAEDFKAFVESVDFE